MRSLSVNLGVILFIVGLSIFTCAEVWGADWRLYASYDAKTYFYDAESIIHQSKDIVKVWVKINYNEKGVLEIVKQLGEDYKNLSYTTHLEEINCKDKMFRFLSINFYSKDGRIIDSSFDVIDEWTTWVKEKTGGGLLYQAVCK
jgi:hypothetical protein